MVLLFLDTSGFHHTLVQSQDGKSVALGFASWSLGDIINKSLESLLATLSEA